MQQVITKLKEHINTKTLKLYIDVATRNGSL